MIAPVGPAIADSTGAGPATIGALVGVFALGQAVGFFAAGALVARRGARTAILLSLLLVAAGCVGFVWLDGLAAWFPARLAMGLGSGGLWIGIVLATIEAFPGQEYRRLTGILAAYSVGAVAGPAFGALEGVHAPFAAFLAVTLAGLVVGAVLPRRGAARALEADRTSLRSPGFGFASAGILAIAIGYGIVEGPLTLHLGGELTQAQLGALYVGAAVVAGAAAVAAGSLTPRPLVGVAALALAAGIALAGATTSVGLWLPALALAAVGIGLGEAGALGVLLEAVGPQRIVTAMVVWSQVWAAGYLAGPVAGGVVAETLGYAALGVVPGVAAVAIFALPWRTASAAPS